MDPSSYHHHHHKHHPTNHPRYVPLSPVHPLPPPPQAPPPYQQSPRNLYPSRHHVPSQILPPPPPPPPQQNQQQPYQPLPPPPPLPRQQYSNHPPYNPHHPQYTSDPNFDPKPNPTHVSHQFHDIPPRRLSEFGTHPDYWPENRVSRPHSVSNLDRETHYHQFERRAASPGIDRFMHDLEGTSRFRDLEPNQGEREDRGRALNDRWISDRSSRDFEIVSFGFDSNSNNSRFDHEVTENMRRGSRLREQLLDSGNKEINERDEMRVFPRKNDYYDSEAERYNDKGSCREGDHELNRTPRKQIQKKSALLRIQKAKPSHRSREDERSHYLGYHNEGKTGTLRGKDLAIHSEHGMEEKQREGTPVELDVSFKSNSLVAKAIVSPAPNSDTNLRPRNTKIRKVMTFDKGSSSCQPNKGNERSAKLGGSSSAVKTASGPVETKQSEGKIKSSDTGKAQDCSRKPCLKGPDVLLRKGKVKKSPKVTVTEDALISDKTPRPLERKGTIPSIGNMGDGVVQPHSIRVNTAVGGNKGEGTVKSIVSDKTGASAGKPSSLKANKKKIIVRKVVKKVVNSSSNLGKSELAKKGDQLVKTDTSARCVSGTSMAENSVIPLKMKLASAFGDSVHAVDSECSPEKSALILENEKLHAVDSECSPEKSALILENEKLHAVDSECSPEKSALILKNEKLHAVDSECSPEKSALILENEKLNEASKDTVLKDVCTDVDPVSSISPNIQRKRNSSTLALSSSSHEDGKATVKKKRRISTSNSSLTLPLNSQSFAVSDILKSAVQVPSNFTDLLPLEPEIKVSSTDDLHAQGIDLLHVNSSVVGPSDAVGSFSDACRGDLPRMDPCSAFAKSFAPSSPCLLPLNLEGEQCSTGTPVSAISNHQIDAMDIEGDDTGKVLVDTAEEQNIISSEVAHCRSIPELKFSCSDTMLPGIDVDDDNHLLLKDDLPSTSNSLISGVDANEVSATNSSDEGMPAPDMLCDVGSLSNLVLSASTCEGHLFQNSEEKTCEKLSDDKPVFEGVCNSSAHVSDSQHSKTILKSNDVILTNESRAGKAGLLPSHDSVSTISLNLLSGETQGRKTQLSHVGPKSYPTRSSFVSSSKNATSSTNITKPRTWHRTDNSSAYPLPGNKPSLSANPMQRQMPTYIRKGNSLVRKPITVPAPPQGSHSLSSSVYRLKSGTGIVDEVKKGTGPNNRADAVELRTAGASTSFERPITPPLSSVTKVPKHPLNSSRECISSPLAEPSTSEDYETTRNHQSSMEINDVLKSPENELKTSETLNRTSSINNLEDLNEQNESGLVPLNEKRVTYVKPKSNQLVATSDCDHASILDVDKNQSFSASSDGYYKKRKNQLIRTALESHMKQAVTMSDDISNSVRQIAAKVISGRTFGKRRSNKVLAKARKPSKFSLVWTPHSARLSNDDGNPPCYPKVRPQLFPWKRMAHRRSFRLSSVSSYNGSLSTIGRKMLLLRKRNTLYTRSTNGFSIRKSKVLSVGGSSLKWSKSIEKHSRKANEEATLAVAEAERKKREQNGPVSGTGKKGLSCHKVLQGTVVRRGERIFRIGSVRYKMDSSRRSLQRISDDASSCSASQQSENSTQKSYVPRRLVIGNDEYVRIGNGNQLVRNPKKRTRVLASEKVRWSLHTARLRLVKKRKYCQFFTRFGKCSKDDGKCPYIHDPSKISVCTKFLKGLCSNPNCKLTHKVIPERMPDCSYFLQGLCTNENCPYRHVHVNPKASTCEGFLRGYCADGNECRKKHSYVCPNFEAAGSCPLGPKCKLHHPKNRSKEKKSKRSMEHKGACGRYFGIDISEPKRMVSERQHQVLEDDSGHFHGKFSDYIKLDVSDDDEAGDLHEVICDQTTFVDNESSDMQLEDLDELIKPIRLINEYKRRESFLVSESSSVEHLAVQ